MKNKFLLIISTILLLASFGCKEYQITSTQTSNTKIDSTFVGDDHYESIISTYRIGIDSIMKVVINEATNTLTKGSPEGSLGNLCADITYQQANIWAANQPDYSGKKVDFALLNNGGLRAQVDSGNITIGDIYQLMPFENQIVILELSGADMTDLIDYVKEKSLLSGRKGGVPVSASFEMTIDTLTQKSSCSINEKLFDSRQTYFVATSDYLANGGDKMTFFSNPINKVDTEIKLRDAFIEFISTEQKFNRSITGKLDGRIHYAP
ncbi:MAG: 5'-nucleotidase C-terminal domain-containing protein [Flavobacteriales bacterium]|nr:5'-nucleotidase C-terminal domain-containing protein [Flavobacteriales bacterium]